jgi:catechol 2,3-dioxygenase-like lactoylglutathione lyase family enzyme
MDPRIHFITVATPDLDAARAFYRRGLGWEPLADVPGEILFFQTGPGLVLGLYDSDRFFADLGAPAGVPRAHGVALSHNVPDEDAVDDAVDALVAAGATLLVPPRHAAFGGYHGHVADPNGIVWEIAHNPGWSVDDEGAVRLNAE